MLEEDLANCKSLAEVQAQTHHTLHELKDSGLDIGYIAGPVSCDGDEHITENLRKLVEARTALMRRSMGKNIIYLTAPFIFTPELYRRLGLFDLPKEDREALLGEFWDELIGSGLLSSVHLAPGWERSPGARREQQTAQTRNIAVFEI